VEEVIWRIWRRIKVMGRRGHLGVSIVTGKFSCCGLLLRHSGCRSIIFLFFSEVPFGVNFTHLGASTTEIRPLLGIILIDRYSGYNFSDFLWRDTRDGALRPLYLPTTSRRTLRTEDTDFRSRFNTHVPSHKHLSAREVFSLGCLGYNQYKYHRPLIDS